MILLHCITITITDPLFYTTELQHIGCGPFVCQMLLGRWQHGMFQDAASDTETLESKAVLSGMEGMYTRLTHPN